MILPVVCTFVLNLKFSNRKQMAAFEWRVTRKAAVGVIRSVMSKVLRIIQAAAVEYVCM
jgi:hypothetical protein